MERLSHTVPASGYMCNPALLFFTILNRYDSNGILMACSAKTLSLSSSICVWICLRPDNVLCASLVLSLPFHARYVGCSLTEFTQDPCGRPGNLIMFLAFDK